MYTCHNNNKDHWQSTGDSFSIFSNSLNGKIIWKKKEKIKIKKLFFFFFFTKGSNSHHKPLRQKMLMSPFMQMKTRYSESWKTFPKFTLSDWWILLLKVVTSPNPQPHCLQQGGQKCWAPHDASLDAPDSRAQGHLCDSHEIMRTHSWHFVEWGGGNSDISPFAKNLSSGQHGGKSPFCPSYLQVEYVYRIVQHRMP